MTPEISIIINTCNEGPRLRATIEAFRENLGDCAHEFVVVADGVTDGYCDNLGADVRVIRNEERIGCGACKNAASKIASGRVLSYWDAHHGLIEGKLADLAAAARAETRIVCPVLKTMKYDDEWRPYGAGEKRFVPWAEGLRDGSRQYEKRARADLKPELMPSAMAGIGMTMTRETLTTIGGWNRYEGLHGSQELGLSLRAFMARVPIAVHGGVIVGHEFRAGRWPYKAPSRLGQIINRWHAYAVVVASDTFDAHLRKFLTANNGGRGRAILDSPNLAADRDHFQASCKRRDDADLLAKLGLAAPAPKIDVRIPYEPDGKLGEDYNRIMTETAHEWVLLLDHDVLILHANWYELCQRAIAQQPNAGIITARTNNVACKDQVVRGAPAGHDIEAHRRTAREFWRRDGFNLTEIRRHLIAGFFMLTRKAVWEKVGGFKPGFLGVDNDYHRRVAKAGFKVWRMDGLYCYHRRERKDRDWLHPAAPAEPPRAERRVIYTVLTGGYDALPAPFRAPGWDYVCFTDDPKLRSPHWDVRTFDSRGLDAVRASRLPKILAHEFLADYDYSIYCDANQRLWRDPTQMAATAGWPDFAACRHPFRQCVYAEIEACVGLKKAELDPCAAQARRYRAAGMPENCGLMETGVMLRRHNSVRAKAIATAWWGEYERAETARDQVAFPFAHWRAHVNFETFSATERNRYFRRRNHARKAGG